jgi:hypothetical protein
VACRFLELVAAIHVVVDGETIVAIVHAALFFCHAFFNLCFGHYCSYSFFCFLVFFFFFWLFFCFLFTDLEIYVAS